MVELFLVVQVRQRRFTDQPMGGHRLHRMQQSQHHVSTVRSRRLGIEQFPAGENHVFNKHYKTIVILILYNKHRHNRLSCVTISIGKYHLKISLVSFLVMFDKRYSSVNF